MCVARVSLLIVSLTLISCGGGSTNTPVPPEPAPIILPDIQPPALSLAKLKPASTGELSTQIKNGLYFSSDSARISMTPAAPDALDSEMGAASGFSQTITQEANVDEADIIKYNGNYLFITTPEHNAIRALKKEPNGALSVLTDDLLDISDNAFVQGMYLGNNTLSVLSQDNAFYDHTFVDFWSPTEQQFSLSVLNLETFDDATPTAVSQHAQTIKFEGNLITSRRVGNTLILLSTYWPTRVNLPIASSDQVRQANLETLAALSVSELLPRYQINAEFYPLVSEENCFIPEDATELNGYSGVVTLTTVDLTDPLQLHSICVNGMYEGIYAAQDDIVIFGQQYSVGQDNSYTESTVLHHFALAGDVFSYNGSANLPGRLDWNQPHLRLSAFDDVLRVVTTQSTADESDRFDHELFALSLVAQEQTLPVLGRLPNPSSPQEIGKPNEDITAVRFFGEKAYIVTFERIDPLYVLDLSEPTRPIISGELEIPGYSSYLLPLNDSFLLGIGQNIDPNRFVVQTDPSVTTTTPIIEGAKVALFDVSTSVPQLVNEVVFEQGATSAEFDYKALTYLPLSLSDIRIGLPVQSWQVQDNLWRSDSRLELVQIDLEGGASLQTHGQVRAVEQTDWGVWRDRTVFDGEHIYYIHHGQVHHALWAEPEVVIGQY